MYTNNRPQWKDSANNIMSKSTFIFRNSYKKAINAICFKQKKLEMQQKEKIS